MKNDPLEGREVQAGSRNRVFPCPAGILVALCFLAVASLSAQGDSPDPFEFRKQQTGYFGPDGEDLDPSRIDEVLIAYFGPEDSMHPLHGGLWISLKIAEQGINASGGIKGKPLRIVPVWTEDPWKGGISDMVRELYLHNILAVIGSVDSASTHLLEQIAAKIRIPVISPISSDKSANLANVPWLFSMIPGDHSLAGLMVEKAAALLEENDPLILISGLDHDSRLLTREFSSLLSERKIAPEMAFEYDPGLPLPWNRIRNQPRIFAVIASAEESASLAGEIRKRWPHAEIIGGPMMGRARFANLCGSDCSNVIYASPGECPPDGDFSRTFARQTGRTPDYAEGSVYDSLRLLGEALEKSGFNRARLLREIRSLPPWTGITGTVNWDPLGHNTRKGSIEILTVPASSAGREE